MKTQGFLLSIVCINLNHSTLWMVQIFLNDSLIVCNSFMDENDYVAYVNPLLEKCEAYAFRYFDIRNSLRRNFDGQVFCPYNYSFEKPQSAELLSGCR